MNLRQSVTVFLLGLFLSVSAFAQNQLLVIEAHQFYPAGGYPSAIGNQTVPANFQRLEFRADSGRAVSGQMTIRCRGGREYRNVGLYGTVQNPCGYNQLVNFDLYLSSPLMAGSYDRLRVYGSGFITAPPTNPPYGGYGDLLANINFNRFYPAQGYMAVGSQNIAGGYSLYRFISSNYSPVRGKLTIRCGNKEFRNVAISPAANGAIFTNPCDLNRGLNMDIYLSSPQVGPGTYGRLQIFGQR